MNDIDVNITGLQDLIKTFRKLPASTQNKAIRPALRSGMVPVKNAAAENVRSIVSSEATGLLSRSLRIYSFKKLGGFLRAAVMIKRGLVTSKGVRVGLYGSVLEYGKKGQPPRSWIRKAAREKAGAALDATLKAMQKLIPQAIEDAKK